jgi:hypothetical protein
MSRTIKWAAAQSGDWEDGNDWVGGAEPTDKQIASLRAFHGTPYTVTLFDQTGVAGLNINEGVTLDVQADLSARQITNDGTLDIGVKRIDVAFSTTFTNNGVVMIDKYSTIIGSLFINNGQLILKKDTSANIYVKEIDNGGTLSGTGAVRGDVVNTGTILGGNSDGFGEGLVFVLGKVDNDSLIEASDGHIITAFSTVVGNGTIDIDGGTFQAGNDGQGGIFSQDVTFGTSASSTFVLADEGGSSPAETYSGVISGFSTIGSSAIELGDMVGNVDAKTTYSGTEKGGVLTIKGDGHADTIAFAGNYLGVTFYAKETPSGTTVTAGDKGGADTAKLSAQGPSVARFISVMGALVDHGGAAGLIAARGVHDGRQVMLAAPRLAIG